LVSSVIAAGPRVHGCNQLQKETIVPNKDEAEGRIKEAAGDLTGDKDLQREGKVDQASGKAKDAIDKASDKAKDAVTRD
jgi:uncharacterized protein YjbJ (UPF0337 family)